MVIFGTAVVATAVTILAPCRAMPSFSYFRPTMKPVMFCRNSSGILRWLHSSTKCAPFWAASENSTPLLAMIPTGMPREMREAGDQRLAEARLELVEARAVDQPGDHLADVIGRAQIGRHHAEDLLGVVGGILRRLPSVRRGSARAPVQVADRAARQRQGMGVVLGQVVGDAREARVHVAAAQVLGR